MNQQKFTDSVDELQDKLETTMQAYQLAVEMSQFKAGFFARIAHELRSPLTQMLSLNQLILSDLCENPAEEREFLARFQIAAKKLMSILDEVIDISRLENSPLELNLSTFSLEEFCQDLQTQTYLQANNRRLKLDINLSNFDYYLYGDYQRLLSAIVLLIDAAFTEMESGKVTINCSQHSDSRLITVNINLPIFIKFNSELSLNTLNHNSLKFDNYTTVLTEIRLFLLKNILQSIGGDLNITYNSVSNTRLQLGIQKALSTD